MIRSDTIQITPEMLALIAKVDEFKGAWRALGTLAPDRLSALRRVATIESIGSSTRIEGSKLSDRDVERLLSNLQIKCFATRDEQEVAGYAEVMELVFSSWQDIPLTENHIRQLHRDLLVHSEKDAWHRGDYKTSSNSVMAFDEQRRRNRRCFPDGQSLRYAAPDDGAGDVVSATKARPAGCTPCCGSAYGWWCSWKSIPFRTAMAGSPGC